jgi:hypothetical protein
MGKEEGRVNYTMTEIIIKKNSENTRIQIDQIITVFPYLDESRLLHQLSFLY